MEHSNAVAYRRTADAFRARDSEALTQLIAEEVVWHVPGGTPLAGDIHGLDALFRWFERLHPLTQGTFTLREHDVLASDDHVVALSDMSSENAGVRVSVNVVSVMHFRDGRQLERWLHPSDPVAYDALLGGA